MRPVPAPLVQAACAGDRAAIARLLTLCQPDLKRFARRTCASAEDAEDAVQIALWQVYRRIGALRSFAAFSTWLFRIVERECYRLFRQQRGGAPETGPRHRNPGTRAGDRAMGGPVGPSGPARPDTAPGVDTAHGVDTAPGTDFANGTDTDIASGANLASSVAIACGADIPDVADVAAPAVPVDLRLDLAAAIAALPEPYRAVLILRDVDELTAPEVADHLGISPEAVKSRLHRARSMVRDRLVRSGYWRAGEPR